MFVKLFQKMLDSSIWLESDNTIRVWVTLLLSMDSDGFAQFASIENLSRRARVKPSLTKRAIEILEAPDLDSTTPDDDGRRIRRVPGGWLVLNCRKYRDISRHGDLRASHNRATRSDSPQNSSDQQGLPTKVSTNEINVSSPEKKIETEKYRALNFSISQGPAMYVKHELGLTGKFIIRDVSEALESIHAKEGLDLQLSAECLVARWRTHLKTQSKIGFNSWIHTGAYLLQDPSAVAPPRKWRDVKTGEVFGG